MLRETNTLLSLDTDLRQFLFIVDNANARAKKRNEDIKNGKVTGKVR